MIIEFLDEQNSSIEKRRTSEYFRVWLQIFCLTQIDWTVLLESEFNFIVNYKYI